MQNQTTYDIDKKLVVKRAKADAKKAEKKYHDLYTVSIENILPRMGYSKDSLYIYKKRIYIGANGFTIIFDIFDLVHKHDGHINVEVK